MLVCCILKALEMLIKYINQSPKPRDTDPVSLGWHTPNASHEDCLRTTYEKFLTKAIIYLYVMCYTKQQGASGKQKVDLTGHQG